jgi:hypothetical protein
MGERTLTFRPFILLALAVIALLLVPLALMPLTQEVNWGLMDFMVMGAMLFITGAVIIIAYYRMPRKNFRVVAVSAVLLFLWLWAELAVGIFTDLGN